MGVRVMRAVRRIDRPLAKPAAPLAAPSDEHPRWRLRVFDRCWPWRATKREALRDAVLSFNARYDRHDRVVYFDAAASLQRDPPFALDRLRLRARQQAREARAIEPVSAPPG